MVQDPAFLIVGTPRSGTTLVQRLASELAGVRVPPETHFFSLFAPPLLGRRQFPLDRARLRSELDRYNSVVAAHEVRLDAEAVVERLGGRCDSLIELFSAVVRALAGSAPILGEKTPTHLLWWRPLTRSLPNLKLVAVVRDPRAVVASNLSVPWGMQDPAVLAQRWADDQRQVASAIATLGPDRCLVLRYEDVVADAEGTRTRLAQFIGVPPDRVPITGPIHGPGETWKAAALGPVTADRVDAWRQSLTARETAAVVAICRSPMGWFHYPGAPPGLDARRSLATLSPLQQWRRLHFKLARYRELRLIGSTPPAARASG